MYSKCIYGLTRGQHVVETGQGNVLCYSPRWRQASTLDFQSYSLISSSRHFLKLQLSFSFLHGFCSNFQGICNFLNSIKSIKQIRYQLPVTGYCPLKIFFRALVSEQRLRKRIGFLVVLLLFFILRLRVAVENQYSKNALYFGAFFQTSRIARKYFIKQYRTKVAQLKPIFHLISSRRG